MGEVWEQVFVAITILAMLVFLYTETWSPEVVTFTCLILVWNAGIIGIDDALKGFSNKGMLAVGTLFVVVRSVEKCQVVEKLSRHVFGHKTSMQMGILRMGTLTFALSAFFNNTPIVALFIPIVRDWARVRGFPSSYFLIPLSYAVVSGGVVTVIGTSTNLVVQGLLESDGLQKFAFFDPGLIGIPLGIASVIYLAFAGPLLLGPRAGLFRDVRDRAGDMLTEIEVGEDFPLAGKSVGLVVSKLGVPPETIIKIRRPVERKTLEVIEESDRQRARSMTRDRPRSPRYATSKERSQTGSSMHEVEQMGKTIMLNSDKPAHEIEMGKVWGEKVSAPATTPKGSMIIHKEKFSGPEGMQLTRDADSRGSGAESSGVTLSGLQRKRVTTGADRAPTGGGTFSTDSENKEEGDSSIVGYIDEYPVGPTSTVQKGDILFLSCSTKTMIDLQNQSVNKTLRGLKVLDVNATDLPGIGTEYFEVVVSNRNHFIGQPVSDRDFSKFYDCTVLSMRRPGDSTTTVASALHAKSFRVAAKNRVGDDDNSGDDVGGTSVEENDDEDEATRNERNIEVKSRTFSPGYTLLLLAKKGFYERWHNSGDFLLVTKVGAMPPPATWWEFVPLVFFLGMIAWVTTTNTEMVRAAMAVAAIVTIGGWVDSRTAVNYVDWGLLLLIGSALGLSSSITKSGLADWIGNSIADSGVSAYGVTYLIYFFTALVTELVTNNAAAAIVYPLCISTAEKLGVDYKAYVMVCMIASSCSYLTPIGYQTNTMVWAPGGYRFIDFTIIGAPMTLFYAMATSAMAPLIWPLHNMDP